MELYKGKNWNVIYVGWYQEFPRQCIISSKKTISSELSDIEWVELGQIEKELR